MFSKLKFGKDSKNEGKIKYIVAGLGNPGEKYTFTRHNIGFRALDYISQKCNFKIDRIKHKSLCGRHTFESSESSQNTENIDGNGGAEKKTFDVLFMKPQTYMNDSGEAVADAARFYKIPPQNIIVVFDDISLPPGKMRIRRSGSDGGHNGLKSIIYHLQSDAFPRIKIGVGEKPHPDYNLADWVLSKFSTQEQKAVSDIFGNIYEALEFILTKNAIDKAMNKFN